MVAHDPKPRTLARCAPLHPPAAGSHGGFTLIELVVALGIAALLLAILIPAVLGIRTRSQRLHCLNQLRQIALAATNYHEAYACLPLVYQQDANPLTNHSYGPVANLTEYLELKPVSVYADEASTVRLGILICPSDGLASETPLALSYLANGSPGKGSGSKWTGPFDLSNGPFRSGKFSDVVDGLTQTAGFSEDILAVSGEGISEDQASRAPSRYYHWDVDVLPLSDAAYADPGSPQAIAERQDQTDTSLKSCLEGPRQFQPLNYGPQRRLHHSGAMDGVYSHWFPPNSPRCERAVTVPPDYFLGSNGPATSYHAGGINVAFLDGHVAFISNSIDATVWRAIGTSNDGEAATP